MSLGVKQLTKDPWSDNKFLKSIQLELFTLAKVRNLTNFGLFLELEEGIDGLVHVSDLSEDKKIKHPSEFIKLGENLDVIVMEQDLENRRLALSHKDIKKEESKKKVKNNIFLLSWSCGRVARQSSAKASTPVRIWSGPLYIIFNFCFFLLLIYNKYTENFSDRFCWVNWISFNKKSN